MSDFNASTVPQDGDGAAMLLRKICKIVYDYFVTAKGSSGYAPSTGGQATVTTTAAQILAPGAARWVQIQNDGIQSVWFDEGGLTPVADSGGTVGPRVGDGRGKVIPPGYLWESTGPITTAIKAVTQSGSGKLTITVSPSA